MRIVDAHVHLYPPEANLAPAAWAQAQGERHWTTLCTRVRKNGRAVQRFPSVDELLREMDAASVERVVLQGWYWETHATCVRQNRFYAECLKAHGDRLSAFATFHAGAGMELVSREIRRAVDEGFCGLGELSPHSQNFSVNNPVWREAMVLAGELGFPVNLHVTEPLSKNYPGKIETPLADFVHFAHEFPQTNFILAHWGARLPLNPTLGTEACACANLFYDTAASPLIYQPKVFREIIDAVGAERVLFGSDFPLNLYPDYHDTAQLGAIFKDLDAAGLSETERAAMIGGTARNLLKII
ncbi:MAG: amidohydrolase family protein [Nibricoccus sp.]